MRKKSGSASGSENHGPTSYAKSATSKGKKSYGKDGGKSDFDDNSKSYADRKPKAEGEEENIWKRPSKSGDRKKPAVKKEVEGDTDNIWKREKKGGRKKEDAGADRKPFAKRDDDRSAGKSWDKDAAGDRKKPFPKKEFGGDAGKKWDRDAAGDRKKPFPKKEFGGDGDKKWDKDAAGEKKRPFPKKEFGGDTDKKWDKDATGDRKKPFPKKEFGGDADKKWDKDATGDRKKPFPKKEFGGDGDRKKPFPKKDFSADGDKKRPYPKKDSDAPYARKPRTESDADKKWDKADGDTERKPRAPKETGSLWQKGIDYSDRGMPKKTGEKKFIKDSDKPFFQRDAAKGGELNETIPEEHIYESYEINDELLEEKKKNRKVVAKKEDPTRAFKKGTNEPISARYGDKPAKKDAEGRSPKKRIDKADEKRPFKKAEGEGKKPFDRKDRHPDDAPSKKKRRHDDDEDDDIEESKGPEAMPLNKYLAHSGVCSRRDAAVLVKEGKVKINGEVITNPGHKVGDNDVVLFNDKKLTIQKGMVYILLNKPKDYITTNEDPQGRKTVMQLVATAEGERLFPVGRLDRNTSGLLLITNDGDLTQKLAHPSNKVKKIYQVTLDKPVTKADFDKIINGLDLEDGIAHVDALAYLDTKSELGIEIHIGRNRIVRRIFESLGYVVEKLDRVIYANLTKKNLPRGKWRYLNEREIVLLKHFKS